MMDPPFLMFQGKCEEALALYTTVIPQSRIIDISRRDSDVAGKNGAVLRATFSVGGLTVK